MSMPNDWMKTLQKAQADFMQQWTAASSAWFPAAATAAPAGPAAGAGGPADLMRQFMSQVDHYAGMSRALWDTVSQAASQPSPEQRLKHFYDGLSALQQQLVGMWGSGTPPASGTMPPPWPALGPNREQQELWQKLTQALTRVTQAQLKLSSHWSEIVAQSLQSLGARLAPELQSGAPPSSMKALYDQWINAAESTYHQVAHGAGFVAAQGELTNALSELRTTQRQVFEQWARQFDLPTRTELNAVHQQLRELRAALARLGGV